MKSVILFLFLAPLILFGQNKTPQDFGFRHIHLIYNNDSVDVLVKSKHGEELKPKPIFLFIQGSLPKPLMIYDSIGLYSVFPFNTDSLSKYYHVVIIGKPYIPVLAEKNTLDEQFCYKDSTGGFPKKYQQRNILDYYVNRDIQVIDYLLKQKWVTNNTLIVSGHSEGSTIAAKLSLIYPKVTHLIYAGGNPMGRIMSIIEKERERENNDSTVSVENSFKYWTDVVQNRNKPFNEKDGDTNKTTYGFSIPPINYLEKLTIPVLISYGTRDECCPFNDFMRVKFISEKKNNFTFQSYVGLEHNYFPLKPNGEINYDIFNWDKVSSDWMKWLGK